MFLELDDVTITNYKKAFCIDYGVKKCGISVANLAYDVVIPSPFAIVETRNLWDFVQENIRSPEDLLILGYHESGQSFINQAVKIFSDERLKKSEYDFCLFDETGSSVEMYIEMQKLGMKFSKKGGKPFDHRVASHILHSFLQYQGLC